MSFWNWNAFSFKSLVKITEVMPDGNKSVYEESLKKWLRKKENATEWYKLEKELENLKNRGKGIDNTRER